MNNKINKYFNKTFFFYFGVILSVLIIVFFIGLKFEYTLSGFYFRFNSSYIDNNIVLVAIDEKTLNSDNFKRYQDINRDDYSTLLRNISYGHPKAIGLDVFFVKNSQNQSEDRELQSVLKQFPNIIIGSEVDNNEITMPFVNSYEGVGYVNTIAYNNLDVFDLGIGKYKNKVPIYFKGGNPHLPLFLEVFKKANGIDNIDINDYNIKYSLGGKNYKIPIDKFDFNINFFAGFQNYINNGKVISFGDVIAGNVNSDVFKDKIVFIGATAKDIHDEFYTPYDVSNEMPGVLLHANAYNTISSGRFLYYQNIYFYILINLILLGLYVLSILRTNNLTRGLIYSGLVLLGYSFISFLIFYIFGYFMDLTGAYVGFVFINTVIFLKKYIEEEKSKNQIKSLFSKYVSKDVVDQIVQVGVENLGLGGQKKELTIFFSDLVGFTSLSEKLDPQELGKILNIYFESMTNIILSNKGTVDKFMGDAIMAFWNAPLDILNHQDLACQTALMQRKALEIVRKEIKKLGVDSVVDMRIGINTGTVLVGNFGCTTRYEYTTLGDEVNLASRLEGINKQYGTNIIISENTYNNLDKSKYFIRELDIITVKGKEIPVRIFELMGFYDSNNIDLINTINVFEAALKYYRDAEFLKAKDIFDKLADEVSKLFSQRCEEFSKLKEVNWDGVYKFKVK